MLTPVGACVGMPRMGACKSIIRELREEEGRHHPNITKMP